MTFLQGPRSSEVGNQKCRVEIINFRFVLQFFSNKGSISSYTIRYYSDTFWSRPYVDFVLPGLMKVDPERVEKRKKKKTKRFYVY